MRGLKERYEVHHGVRIKDSAILAAVLLSHRYITDRFLPDKAIDLIDEAAASLRMQIDSMPVEIDAAERAIVGLEIERQALSKESDRASVDRLFELERELSDLSEQATRLKARWQSEKEGIQSTLELWGFNSYVEYLYTMCELGFLEGLIPVIEFDFLEQY